MSTDSKDEEGFNSEDLSTIKILVEVEDRATGVSLKDPTQVSLIEIQPDGFVISSPAAIRVSHLVQVRLTARSTGIEIKSSSFIFDCTAKVKSSAKQGDDTYRLTLQLVQFDSGEWDEFQKKINARQEAILRLFEANRE